MPSKTPKTSEQEDVAYEIFILRGMLQQLPPKVAQSCLDQFAKVVDAVDAYEQKLKKRVLEELDEIRANVQYLDFDLEATRRERDALHKRFLDP